MTGTHGNIVNYAAAVIMEVRQPASGGQPVIRFNFKNGTDDPDFIAHNLTFSGWSGDGDVPLSTFLTAFEPAAINTTLQWCGVCNQTTARGCGDLLAPLNASTTASTHHDKISPVGAGFLGAGLTVAVFLMAFGVLFFLGFLSLGGKKKGHGKGRERSDGSEVRPVIIRDKDASALNSTRSRRVPSTESRRLDRMMFYEEATRSSVSAAPVTGLSPHAYVRFNEVPRVSSTCNLSACISRF